MVMNGVLLFLPFFAVRFLLPLVLNPGALARAAYFAPMQLYSGTLLMYSGNGKFFFSGRDGI